MKASIYQKYGSPDVLNIQQVEKPQAKGNEILVQVHAATVNRTDCAMLSAKPFIMRFSTGLFKPKKQILGTDFAGVVVEVGAQVSKFKMGDRVFGFDDRGIRSHAEYLNISETNALALIPENISFEQAAAGIEGGHYAYNFINKVELKKGQKVLVNGATGAIGSAMVQLLKYYGVEITAVCRAEHANLVKSMGAVRVIDYLHEDFTLLDESFDFVFDAVGKSSFKKCKKLLKEKGIYISSELGEHIENPFLAISTSIYGKKKVKFPLPLDKPRSVKLIQKLMGEDVFNPVIDKVYSLDDTSEAFRHVQTGQKVGNVVLRIL